MHIKVEYNEERVILRDYDHFDLGHTLDCGQAFRWNRYKNGYIGVAFGRILYIEQQGTDFIFHNTNKEDFQNIWVRYFDLSRDYGLIKEKLRSDLVLHEAIEYGWGMRILRQDEWECTVSFILSANNHIPRIKGCIDNLCRARGDKVEYDGQTYFTFPSVDIMASLSPEDIGLCRCGYRAEYLSSTARMINKGEVDLYGLNEHGYDFAGGNLTKLSGVGPKVADCIMLYSMGKFNVFPTDVWIKRVIEELYLGRIVSIKTIQDFAKERYGGLAGFAQQYLFYFARENKIGKINK